MVHHDTMPTGLFHLCGARLLQADRLSLTEFENLDEAFDDAILLIFAEFGKDRECENFFACEFCMRKIACTVTEKRETFLQMQRRRIIHRRADLPFAQRGQNFVATVAFHTDDELIEDMAALAQNLRKLHCVVDIVCLEELCISPGILLTSCRPIVQMSKFDTKHGGLQRIEPAVESDFDMPVSSRISMHAQAS